MTAGAEQVSVRDSIDDIDPAEWSSVLASAQAPVFYDYRFLRAYERAPLQPTEAFCYLRFGDPAVAVLPAYVQSTDDPLGVVASLGLQDADLVLGADFLRSRRVWLSYRSHLIFVGRP